MRRTKKGSWCPPDGEARIRLKFRSLLQDFEELVTHTEAKKNRLEKAKRKKRILSEQVKFLRRKYESFVKNQPEKLYLLKCHNVHTRDIGTSTSKHQQEAADHVVHRTPNSNSRLESKPKKKNNNSRPKETALPGTMASKDLNQTTVPNGGEAVAGNPRMVEKTLEKYQREDSYPAADNIKLLVYTNVSKEAAKTRKRTISWQDPVALWVES